MIPAGARRTPIAAAKFIDWITTPEVQQKHVPLAFAGTATIGVEPDCARSCRTAASGARSSRSMRRPIPPTDQAFTKELMDGFFEVQDGIIAGRISPEDVRP